MYFHTLFCAKCAKSSILAHFGSFCLHSKIPKSMRKERLTAQKSRFFYVHRVWGGAGGPIFSSLVLHVGYVVGNKKLWPILRIWSVFFFSFSLLRYLSKLPSRAKGIFPMEASKSRFFTYGVWSGGGSSLVLIFRYVVGNEELVAHIKGLVWFYQSCYLVLRAYFQWIGGFWSPGGLDHPKNDKIAKKKKKDFW